MDGREKGGRGRSWRRAAWLSGCVLALALSFVALNLEVAEAAEDPAWLVFLVTGAVVVWAAGAWVHRRLLWRVGRRLAFSYMLLFLLGLGLTLLAWELFGYHLQQAAETAIVDELAVVSDLLAQRFETGRPAPADLPAAHGKAALAWYRDDVRVGGDPRAPAVFADGWVYGQRRVPQWIELSDGSATLAASLRREGSTVMAFRDPALRGPLEDELSRRSNVWTALESLVRSASGTSAPLPAPGRADTFGWFLFFGLLAVDVFILAAVMALFMIRGLNRAVNRLSAATGAVREGDFSVRIPVWRRDQLGALQTSFNEMAGSLEGLVADRAAKHALEQELEIAREVQRNLVPARGPRSEGVEFATYFEPAAAIGGDYFDILPLPAENGAGSDRLAVVVADVAGHGLSAGLRMAMLKAGLLTLVDEGKAPREIFSSLDRLVRSGGERTFVTSSLSVVDPAAGVVEVTNAGHPPTYLLRRNQVEEIVLPGTPLGALGEDYGFRRVELEAGDVVVWLSDGLIEAVDGDDEPFGYDRTRDSIAGPADSAGEVRGRVLADVRRHTGGAGVDDDLTLVVMRYQPGDAAATAAAG